MNQATNHLIIKASPTKEFFISMLTKDIELIPAIADLIDNSVDGARRMRPGDEFDGLWVRLAFNDTTFSISDNCGGISVLVARDYAFRFGRAPGAPETPHSVGQFGVGMKRALFKIGGEFEVESNTATSHFRIVVNVDEWRRDPDSWELRFAELQEYPDAAGATEGGTTITITALHESVSDEFKLEQFANRLKHEIELRHQYSMNQGLAISINGIPLTVNLGELIASDILKPAYERLVFSESTSTPVTARIYAGLAESSPTDAGWYIFCNARLVLPADQSIVTGWGWGNGRTIPRFHNQFAMFRGYALFDSDDSSQLPWNTTKTGVDVESEIYRATRVAMIRLMRPVITFLNQLDAEKTAVGGTSGPLATAVSDASSVKVTDVPTAPQFMSPQPATTKEGPKTVRLQYDKPIAQVEEVMRALKATSYKQAGERTFDYFYKAEIE